MSSSGFIACGFPCERIVPQQREARHAQGHIDAGVMSAFRCGDCVSFGWALASQISKG
jgi:hypothetical protein